MSEQKDKQYRYIEVFGNTGFFHILGSNRVLHVTNLSDLQMQLNKHFGTYAKAENMLFYEKSPYVSFLEELEHFRRQYESRSTVPFEQHFTAIHDKLNMLASPDIVRSSVTSDDEKEL